MSSTEPMLYDGDQTGLGDATQSMNTVDDYHGADGIQDGGDDAEGRDRAWSESTIIDETNSGFSVLRTGSVKSGAVNMAQAALGAGTLSMPYAMKSAGVGLGAFFILLCGITSVFTVRLLIMVRDKTGHHTYEEIAKHVGNPALHKITALLISLFCWGITVVYVIAIGDIVHPLTDGPGWPHVFKGDMGKKICTILFWGLFMLPLSLLRDINSLRYASLFALVTLIFLILSIIIYGFSTPGVSWSKNVVYAEADVGMVCALPTIFFSYCCQCNAFEIYHEMRPKTIRRMTRAATMAMSFATVMYLSAGIAGLAAFGSATDGNILNNFAPRDHVYMIIAFLGFAFTITFSFPVCLFPMRDAFLQVFGLGDVYTASTLARVAVAGSLATVSLLIGLFVTSIVVVFDVVGGVCGSTLAFTFPALFALRSKVVTWDNGKVRYVITVCIFFGGIIAGALGTGVGIYTKAKPSSGGGVHNATHIPEPTPTVSAYLALLTGN